MYLEKYWKTAVRKLQGKRLMAKRLQKQGITTRVFVLAYRDIMLNRNESVKKWVADHTEALYKWAYSKLSDHEIARDLVQDTFIAAYEKYDTYEGKSSSKTWLMSILNHKIMDHYRRQYRSPIESKSSAESEFFDDEGMWHVNKRPASWDETEELLDNNQFNNTLNSCMEKLPQQWRSVIQMKYLREKGGNEVCRELAITETNYWQIVRRAKLNLRQCLEINWFKR